MAGDPLSPVFRGDPLVISAAGWNEVLAAARDRRQPPRPLAAAPSRGQTGFVEALALNSTGADLREFKPAKVTGGGGYTVTNDTGYDWSRRPVLTLGVPVADTDVIAVTLEAIPDGEYGRVAVAGWCLCDVDVGNSSHGYASPTTDTDALVSGTSGSVRIVATGTGTARRTQVYLGDQLGGGGSGSFSPTQNVPAFNTTLTGNGTWVDVTSVSLSAGTWGIWYAIGGQLTAPTVGDYLGARLDLSGGLCQSFFANTQVPNVNVYGTASGVYWVTLGSTTTIKLQASRNYSGAAPSVSTITGGLTVHTNLMAIKLG